MMALWYGSIFHITGLLWWKTIGHRWILITKESLMWVFDVSFDISLSKTVKQTVELQVICSRDVTVMTYPLDVLGYGNIYNQQYREQSCSCLQWKCNRSYPVTLNVNKEVEY